MPRKRINDIELYYEVTGSGPPIVLVHGGWTDHASWQFAVPRLARRHTVACYDRRGHSRSERPGQQGSRRTDEDDLIALIEHLGFGPANVVGNSYGASIALGVRARRPDVVRCVVAHEPPLLGVAAPGTPLAATAEGVLDELRAVADRLRRGDLEGGAARFIERVALGPGSWTALPKESRRVLVANAATFLDVIGDPDWATLPLPPVEPAAPLLLTDGTDSPAWMPAVVDALVAGPYREAARHTIAGAGHAPHLTHPEEWCAVVGAFLEGLTGVPADDPTGDPDAVPAGGAAGR